MSLALPRKRIASLVLLALAIPAAFLVSIRAQPQTPPATITLCVNDNPPPGGTGDGSSWANAMTSLDAALAAAPIGAHIWVAQGTYSPANVATGFVVNKQLRLYGGFVGDGSELSLASRHGSFERTLLEGDLLGNDNLVPPPANPYADNATHVVSIYDVGGTPGVAGVVIDGFRIAHGFGGPTLGLDGAGIWSHCSDVDVANCFFDHNWAREGGAIWFTGGCNAPGEPQVTDVPNTLHVETCEFFDNHADQRGGAIWGDRWLGWTVNTKFVNNLANPFGGAVYVGRTRVMHSFDFANCVFWENRCTPSGAGLGGAIYLDQDATDPLVAAHSEIVNCTFAGNFVSQPCRDGQAVFVTANAHCGIHNSILWWNHDLEFQLCLSSKPIEGPATVEYSNVEFGWQGGIIVISSDPLFVAGGPPPSNFSTGAPPPNIVLPLLTLRKASATTAGSKCIDHADYDSLPDDLADLDEDGVTAEKLPVDLLDSTRFVDRHNFGEDPNQGAPAGGIDYTDMGAYERSWP